MGPDSVTRVSGIPLMCLLLVTLLTGMCVSAEQAQAAVEYDGPLMYGLDPLLGATEDPRLLGVERLVMRRRLLSQGVDPFRDHGERPSLYTAMENHWHAKAKVDLRREKHLTEFNGALGLFTTISYPKYFILFPPTQTLPGGFPYYPPRNLGAPDIKLFVDDPAMAFQRIQAVEMAMTHQNSLDIAGKGKIAGQNEGLLNLTIPIKLPRTLEKIIGRGEKTRIKISGRERISIAGESTVVSPFVPSERVQSQSLFPSLDMEQELQISLSGNIGEKIIIEVDHNSAALGPDATKIKLMYQGLEDEIIKTIETGDVGLTLPGSQLLGYSSNKSGLFGIKVTGQIGRLDFTTVASKQKAEASSKTFNSKGGEVSAHYIDSSRYLNNRFFRMDLPPAIGAVVEVVDTPGRDYFNEFIDPESIQVFHLQSAGQSQPNDVDNIAAYRDVTGRWQNITEDDLQTQGRRWREIDFDLMMGTDDEENRIVALDLRREYAQSDELAVVYDVVDAAGTFIYSVGEKPDRDLPTTYISEEGPFYQMKLLKLNNARDVYTYQYVLRNIYSLGATNIDPESFDLKLEALNQQSDTPNLDPSGLEYIRIFGLDQENPQGDPTPDGLIDKHLPYLIDLNRGLLKFPLDFPKPFAPDDAADRYYAYADSATTGFEYEGSFLAENQTPQLYNPEFESTISQYGRFRFVSEHAAASSTFNLGVSNIEEGSETVTLDGRTLSRGVDYEIDYTFGQISLKGDAANLTADSKISVNYSYAPFFGGGKSSLMGLNLAYDLGRESTLSTTWLYQTESIVGEKAKLGEEPSKTLVGNVNLNHTFRPYFLTHVANFISRPNTEKESTLQFQGEMAVSLPNPNTKGQVYLEDFEGVDASDVISLTRTSWFWPSIPIPTDDSTETRIFDEESRVSDIRWFIPKERVLRRYLNPDLVQQERDETQQSMDIYMYDDDGSWDANNWGGIMRAVSRTGMDLSKSQFLEFWINDGVADKDLRSGKLHIDFGYISEDGFWPLDEDGAFILEKWEQEDGIATDPPRPDGVFDAITEDIGLDGQGASGPQEYKADYEIPGYQGPFPRINGTALNSREDTEDLNGNTRFDTDNGYFSAVVDLKDTDPLVDVVYDYNDVGDLVGASPPIAWRKYRIRISDSSPATDGTLPNINLVTHMRVWYENEDGTSNEVRLQISDLKFLGSRWEREGIRRITDESLTDSLLPNEEFFLGEVNNKENPDYSPPFAVHEQERIPEKEQSLVLDFTDIQRGNMVRASKQVSVRGDDYTRYQEMTWYWNNPSHDTADVDLFFRVGADTLNYYEVAYKFSQSPFKVGWKQFSVNLAQLSNAKNAERDPVTGIIETSVVDSRTGESYVVRVAGRPDLRKVKRYYFGMRNDVLNEPTSGYFYFNDVKLEGVKTDKGFAKRVGLRLNMADVIKVDFDWTHQDAEYHGLNQTTGQGYTNEDWSLSTNFNVNDFIPLAGFRLPVNLSRRQLVARPKYETNSDIEILDENVRNELSSLESSERFTTRLSHTQSKGVIPRYLIDPWVLSLNGSRGEKTSPIRFEKTKSLQGSVAYDIRLPSDMTLGKIPGLGSVPIIKGLTLLPKHVAFGGNFSSNYSVQSTVSIDGELVARPANRTRPARLNATVDFQPLTVLDISVTGNSERDMLRERKVMGINIGQENKRNYNLRLTITPPRLKQIPAGGIYAPIRTLVSGMESLRPSIKFTGSFTDNHDPGIRAATDPATVRNLSNDGNWEFRANVPIGNVFKSVFPKRRYSDAERRRIADREASRQQNEGTAGQSSSAQSNVKSKDLSVGQTSQSPNTGGYVDPENMTPEEQQRAEEERLIRAAEERAERELEEGRGKGQEAEPVDTGSKFKIPNPLSPLLNVMRETQPLKITYTDRRASSYSRAQQAASFWYKTGLSSTLDMPDTLFVGNTWSTRQGLDLSTTTKIVKTMSLDVKYNKAWSTNQRIGAQTRDYKQDWPDVQVSLTGMEKWGVLGGDIENPDESWFKSSAISFTYRRSKTVNGMSASSYNPTVITTINPRWTFNFHSGFQATLSGTLSKDEKTNNGNLTLGNKTRVGLQLKHQFKAQGFLTKLGLYRPGSNPSISMDVDLSYEVNKSERINATGLATTPTGTRRINANPRFSYQITRNLSGSVRFIFSKNNNLSTGVSTTTLGLGVEATFVF